MHFARPEYFHLFWLLPVLAAFFVWSHRRRRHRLERLISPALVGPLTGRFSRAKAVWRSILLLAAFAFAIAASARPQWGAKLETIRRQGVDIIVALDTSYSMNAEDIAPTRLERAKGIARSLISRLSGDRIGVVSFAGTAVLHCPLTLDYGAARLFLDVINTEIVPEPGTSLASAIDTAAAAFSAHERQYKVLVIVTDGEDLRGEVQDSVAKAREQGVVIYTVGVGTPEGRPIPVRDEKGDIVEYRKDPSGQVVISRLDERTLAQVANDTGGRYFRATAGEGEIDAIHDEVSQLEKKELDSRVFRNLEDRFQLPLALAVLCLAAEAWLSDRKRVRATAPGERVS